MAKLAAAGPGIPWLTSICIVLLHEASVQLTGCLNIMSIVKILWQQYHCFLQLESVRMESFTLITVSFSG